MSMGAAYFEHVVLDDPNSDIPRGIDAAFVIAHGQATWDYGHAGYTGTIAEKDEARRVSGDTYRNQEEARQEARNWEESHFPNGGVDPLPRATHDKWGPANALRFNGGWLFFGWASC